MADLKDSAIKLFGKTIPLRRSEEVSCTDEPSAAVSVVESDAGESCSDRKVFVPSSNNNTTTALPDQNSSEEDKETRGKENCITEKIGEEEEENEESPSAEQSEISDSQEKTLKRPDKIIPCPRCNSMDTKFCYYNNYNVNQPRHFCKNCQRYWTAGGTMRNVPVGAGRRKNKSSSSASHYRHLVISDALHRAQANATAGGTVLTFAGGGGSEKSSGGGGGDNQSSCSSVTATTSSETVGKQPNKDPFAQVPLPWPYPWPSPGFCHSGFPVSFYPAPPPYWGSAVAGPWSVPCFPAPSQASSLGKRARDGEILNPASKERAAADGSDRPVLIPKTLRIDDPTEAAKSSIWATLGIKNEKLGGSVSGGGLYNVFQSKGDGKSHVLETSPVLQANPAALSRSLRFLEST